MAFILGPNYQQQSKMGSMSMLLAVNYIKSVGLLFGVQSYKAIGAQTELTQFLPNQLPSYQYLVSYLEQSITKQLEQNIQLILHITCYKFNLG